MSDPLPTLAGLADRVWLVGGAVRDRLLGRATSDFDVVLADGETRIPTVAKALGREAGGFAFALSEAFGAWRVVDREHHWQVDLSPLGGETIEADLARRDLTVNALAHPLASPEELLDPAGGLADLEHRRLRAVSDHAFTEDPLRTLRVARFAAELGFTVASDTLRLARASAPGLAGVSAERVFAELRRLLCAPGALIGLGLMDEVGVTPAILPELVALRGIEQSRFHHLDVYDHTRSVLAELIALEEDPEPVFGADTPALLALLAEPLADELSRGQALRFGALLHDVAKPQTRAVTSEGRVTFLHHDEAGAELGRSILARLRGSERLADYVAALARHHLRLGFLVHQAPLNRRAVYRYLYTCDPVAVEVTVLSVADRLATRGDGAERAIARHLTLARELLPAGLAWRSDPPRPPVRGDALATALGLRPGPRLGELLHELEEAGYAGEVSSAEEAIAYARQRVRGGGEH